MTMETDVNDTNVTQGRSIDADDAGSSATVGVTGDAGDRGDAGLLEERDGDAFRTRWEEIQVGFVDEPRESVERADHLVGELMEQLTDMFDRERQALESRWESGDDVSTEDLRIVLQRYRSFFGRLLAA
jgi:hypothetical protein